jgi:acyl-coenzyme A synthetase/AMP-(fatty) acid ligase
VEKGDRVVVYMPMVPEAAVAMLACARLGAVHSVVFGGFAPKELAKRIDDAQPEGRRERDLRARAQPDDRLQAPARRGDRIRGLQA